jgi:RNA polymerase sigma-70 factor (ECF subfamily)
LARTQSPLSDEQLIVQIIQQGDTALFGILYDRYANKVYRKCMSFVKKEEAAQDMVQEIFLKVFYQLARFKGKSRFSTWLYAITYNYCVEQYRRQNRHPMVELDERLDQPDDDKAEQEFLETRLDVLKKALDKVAPEDKVLLMMKYQDDISIKEIMTYLDISESAVKMRLSRARQRVREAIQEMEPNIL